MAHNQLDWIAVDWGTSNLRVWLFAAENRLIAHAGSDRGMGQLVPDQFEPALLDLIGGYLPAGRVTPVICCGMVGARQGWVEAPYASTPCAPPTALEAIAPAVADPRLDVRILPGVKQDHPADVMRGEETQIAGYLSANPGYDGVLCLPGTHTKWAQISAGQITGFQTFMTGELFSLLLKHSVLRHSLTDKGWEDAAFGNAVGDAMSAPEKLSARLFSIRAEGLLHGVPSATLRARLSGCLIGLELAAARRFWQGPKIMIIGDGALSAHYARALSLQGITAGLTGVEKLTLAGLTAAYTNLKETNT